MNSFDVELSALIERWRGLGASDDELCDALEKEFDALEDMLIRLPHTNAEAY